MKSSGPIASPFQSRLATFLFAVALVPAVLAGSRTSANYTITADTVDAGGTRVTSAAYINDGSLGNIAGGSTAAAYTLTGGYVAQLLGAGAPVVSNIVANGTYNVALTPIQIVGTNSPTSFTATALPSGVSVDTSLGIISGTPTAVGVFDVTITAGNSSGMGSGTLTLTIGKAPQTITFAGPSNRPFTSTPIPLVATSSSGLGVSFSVLSGPGTITGGTNLTLSGPGTVVIRASQAGNTSYQAAANVDRTLVVSAAAAVTNDFNGDGKADIIWKNSNSGEVGFYLMNGTGFGSWVDIGAVAPEWHIAATADFDGDGQTDILWENASTGERGFWLMNGTGFVSWQSMGVVSTDWHIAGAADFNGDGKPDIVWENKVTGDRGFYLMNGTAFSSWVGIGVISTDLKIVAVGDFNGDHKADLVWENTVTGKRVIWLMNGTTFTSSVSLGFVGVEWHIASAADYDGDGKPDLVWENTTTGERFIWLMNGTVYSSGVSLGTVTTDWRIGN